MYVYYVYPAILKNSKQVQNSLKIDELSVVLIVFIGVICEVSAYTVTISFSRSAWITYQKGLLGPWHYNTDVYFTPFISTQNHTIAG